MKIKHFVSYTSIFKAQETAQLSKKKVKSINFPNTAESTSFINPGNNKLNHRKLTNAFFGKLTSSIIWFFNPKNSIWPDFSSKHPYGDMDLGNKQKINLISR